MKLAIALVMSSLTLAACQSERKDYSQLTEPTPPNKPAVVQVVNFGEYAATAGNYSSPLITKDKSIVFGAGPEVHFLNPDGSPKAVFTAGDIVLTKPTELSDGTIVVGSLDRQVYFLNPDGTKKATFKTGGPIYASPVALSDDTVVVGSLDTRVYFINPDGTEKASFKTGDWVLNTPAVQSDGTVVVLSTDKKLYRLNPDGSLKNAAVVPTVGLSAPLILADDSIVFGSVDHNIYFAGPDGTIKFQFTTGGEVLSRPAVTVDGTVVAGSGDGKLYFLDPNTGLEKSSVELTGGHITTPLMLSNGGLVVGAGKTQYFLNADGSKAAQMELPSGSTDPTQFQPAQADGVVVVISSLSIHCKAYFLKLITLN